MTSSYAFDKAMEGTRFYCNYNVDEWYKCNKVGGWFRIKNKQGDSKIVANDNELTHYHLEKDIYFNCPEIKIWSLII